MPVHSIALSVTFNTKLRRSLAACAYVHDGDLIVVVVAEPVEGHQSLTDYKARHTRTAPTHKTKMRGPVNSKPRRQFAERRHQGHHHGLP
jgi:hypothetical protein